MSLSGYHLRCPSCGHFFDPKGTDFIQSCPMCGTEFFENPGLKIRRRELYAVAFLGLGVAAIIIGTTCGFMQLLTRQSLAIIFGLGLISFLAAAFLSIFHSFLEEMRQDAKTMFSALILGLGSSLIGIALGFHWEDVKVHGGAHLIGEPLVAACLIVIGIFVVIGFVVNLFVLLVLALRKL